MRGLVRGVVRGDYRLDLWCAAWCVGWCAVVCNGFLIFFGAPCVGRISCNKGLMGSMVNVIQ